MFDEKRATSLRYDAGADTATIALGSCARALARVEVTLLLDAAGFLVGVDLGGEGPGRVVVMLGRGRHEDVGRTRSMRAEVARTESGQLDRIAIPGARAAARASEPNPYL